ncbi:hypothetical protein VCRA2123O443_200061 [Vibrio crassostreae]|nr:hypothetical protein VCRA2110O182_200033 [Vibrio crassostreae]CAK2305992.1 hypothetical protein VCRA2111O408_200062 [Vibrio crassostreae]CAK2322190.1 hypothetical protein VCRA211O406_200032 [Vibrio crassostreae]CAK3225609.1 hypothetical protein VCRA2123O443_200061 [Vibrio crassostreae]
MMLKKYGKLSENSLESYQQQRKSKVAIKAAFLFNFNSDKNLFSASQYASYT